MKLFIFFFVSVLLAFSISGGSSYFIKKGLRKSNVDFYGKIGAACNSEKGSNLLLVGNSRVLDNLDPRVFDSITGLKAYNYGVSAAAIKTCYNVIKAGLQNQKNTKAVILNIDYNMFRTIDDPYKDAYYYSFEQKIPGLLKTDSGNINLVHSLKLFDIALFDDVAKFAALNAWLHPDNRPEGTYDGFYPETNLTLFNVPLQREMLSGTIPMTVSGVNTFIDIIKTCKTNKIQLVLVVAPYYKVYHPRKFVTNYDSIINQVNTIAVKNNLPFLDYSDSYISADRGNFKNYNHLNAKGAMLYSTALADTLQKILTNNL